MEQLDLQQLERMLYVLVGFIFIVLVALVAYVLVAGRRQRAKTARSLEEDKLVPRPALNVGGQILALIRDEPGGALQVEIGGNRYRSLADVEDAQTKRQVVAAAMELIQFTGVLGSEVPPPPPVGRTGSWREDLRKDSQTELERIRTASSGKRRPSHAVPAPEEVEQQFLSLLSGMGHALAQPDKPGIVSSLQHTLTPKPVDRGRPRTFVDDIEDIVQRRIQLIPALAGRSLHIRPGPGGKVRFLFDGQHYENVDDVPNLTARQLIKDAIQEWDETT